MNAAPGLWARLEGYRLLISAGVMGLWARTKGYRLLIVAGVMTAAEGAVALGVPLPFSDQIPPTLRGVLIAGIGAAAFVLKVLAQRQEGRRG